MNVDGSMSGLLIEYGKTFRVGPVLFGGSLGVVMGKPSVTGKVNGVSVESKDINSGVASINAIPQAGIYLGYSF